MNYLRAGLDAKIEEVNDAEVPAFRVVPACDDQDQKDELEAAEEAQRGAECRLKDAARESCERWRSRLAGEALP
ncbi:hypothetical protein AK812_SmicGene164 [Symbiodinium microadriaticum]|uniref:Uncharacterized protein n=1 Tax=Symbiodinium microadriaticum TaxID=2951 RepID=A0A1Q9F774_SYMMI|nr:hypothetical protein AK812_SmicGene164 [Symbiodinium microadriaticum]